jgi:2-oxoglutarate dehydrogenase E1 component
VPANVVKLVFCTGKLYYELIEERNSQKNESIAIIRIEQLYPFPQQAFDRVIKKYSRVKDLIWAQEEPENMGAWAYLLRTQHNNYSFKLYSRAESGSPATGSSKRHAAEQARLVKNVISDSPTH